MTNTAMKAGHDHEQSLTQTIKTQKGRETGGNTADNYQGRQKDKRNPASTEFTMKTSEIKQEVTKHGKHTQILEKGIKGNM